MDIFMITTSPGMPRYEGMILFFVWIIFGRLAGIEIPFVMGYRAKITWARKTRKRLHGGGYFLAYFICEIDSESHDITTYSLDFDMMRDIEVSMIVT